MGTAAHLMREAALVWKLLAWFKLFCKQIGQLQMPGTSKYGMKICFGESTTTLMKCYKVKNCEMLLSKQKPIFTMIVEKQTVLKTEWFVKSI